MSFVGLLQSLKSSPALLCNQWYEEIAWLYWKRNKKQFLHAEGNFREFTLFHSLYLDIFRNAFNDENGEFDEISPSVWIISSN